MNVIAIAIAGAFFVLGIYIGRVTDSKKNQSAPTPLPTPPAQVTSTGPKEGTPSGTPLATTTPAPTKTMAPTPQQSSPSSSLDTFFYSGGTVKNKTNSGTQLETSDDATKVTAWYEGQIKSQGFKSTSVAKTNTNGTIINKISASKNNTTINISIQRKAGESVTYISVEQTSGNSANINLRVQNGEEL